MRRKVLVLAVAVVVALTVCSLALAAAPLKGKTYRGTGNFPCPFCHTAFSFTVSADGKTVNAFKFGPFNAYLPIGAGRSCGGAGYPVSRPATVSKNGTFKVTLALADRPSAFHGSVVVSGTFDPGGAAHGTIASHFAGSGAMCNATAHYTTHAH